MKHKRTLLSLLMMFCSLIGFAQSLTVSGVVVDANSNEPLIGASVVENGTTNGTVTDFDGAFTLSVKQGAKLSVSYMGYTASTVEAKNNIRISLMEETHQIDELVVVGYGVQRKSDLTGAISSVNGEDLTQSPVAGAVQALQGKAAGVQVVQNSGAPGSSTSIKIRGTGTINDSDPLYVVDGFIVDNIDNLSNNDIANIEILKDAASSAIYGARGANGVVLITTKKGEAGKIKVDLDIYAGFSQPWKRINVLGLEDFALVNDYTKSKETYSAGGKLYYDHAQDGSLVYNPFKYQMLDSLRSKNGCGDWWDAVTQTGVKQNYNLSMSGGGDNCDFRVSLSYYDDKGIVKTSRYQRFTGRAGLNYHIFKWLHGQTNIAYTYSNQDIVPEGSSGILKQAIYQSPLTYLRDVNGYWASDHVIARLDRNHNNRKKYNTNINQSFTFNLGKYVTYQLKVSDYVNIVNREQFTEVQKLETEFVMPSSLTSFGVYETVTNKWEVNNLINFNWKNNKHSVGVTVGQTAEGYSYRYRTATRKGADGNGDNYHQLSAGYTGDYTRGYLKDWSALGFVGRVNYAALDRYLFQVNFRADASSLFNKKNRWGLFPSVSAGWKFSSEPWLQDQNVLSLGKIRAGWGMLGNNRIDEYARYTIISASQNYIFGTSELVFPGAIATTMGNDNITWEKTQSYNIGLDLNFLRNSLTTSFEYFDKLTTDMLLSVPVVLSAGLNTAPMVNAGSVRNRGVEATISYKGSAAKNKFKYSIGLNISYINNRVESLGSSNEPVWGARLSESSINDYVTKTAVGRPIGCFYGYVVDGIFNSNEEVANSAQAYDNINVTTPPVTAGCFKFKDLNQDGIINEEDRTYLGSPLPDVVYGIPISLSYWGFTLDIFFQGQAGNKIFNVMEYYLSNGAAGTNMYADINQMHWSGGPDHAIYEPRTYFPENITNAVCPDLFSSDAAHNFRASNYYVQDGSYCRLKTLTLTYSFNDKICKKMHARNFSIYASGYNVLTFTKYKGLDPEVGKYSGEEGNNLYMGVDHGNYPQSRTFTFGIKVGF